MCSPSKEMSSERLKLALYTSVEFSRTVPFSIYVSGKTSIILNEYVLIAAAGRINQSINPISVLKG